MTTNIRNNPLLRHHTQSLLLFVFPSLNIEEDVCECVCPSAGHSNWILCTRRAVATHIRTIVGLFRQFFFSSLRSWIDKIKSPENKVYLHFGRNFSLRSSFRRIFRRIKKKQTNRLIVNQIPGAHVLRMRIVLFFVRRTSQIPMAICIELDRDM